MAKKKSASSQKQKKHHVPRFIFYMNIALAVGIIGLTVYDYSMGHSFIDGSPEPRVLAEQATPTPTPTYIPQLP